MGSPIDTRRVVEKTLEALDWETLIENNFKDPDDPDQPFKFLPWQRSGIRTIQYSPKKGFMALAPRGYAKTTLFELASCAACIAPPLPYKRIKVAYFSIGLDEALRSISVTEQMLLNSNFAHLIPKKHDKRIIPFLHNGSYIRAFPQSEGVRGGRFHYIVFDEWSRLADDFVKGGCRRLLAKIGIKELGGSTPFGASGDFYEMWVGDEFTPQNDPYDRLEVQDIKEFDKFGNLIRFESEVPWMTQEEYERLRAQLGPAMADQELDATFLGTGATLIRHAWIKNAYDYKNKLPWYDHEIDGYCDSYCREFEHKKGYSPHRGWFHIPKMVAGDFGRDNDYTVIIVGCRIPTADGSLKIAILYIKRFRMTDYDYIEDEVVDVFKRFNAPRGIFDGNGVGEPVLDHIEKKLRQQGLNVSLWKTATKRLDEPGKPDLRKLRLGYLSSGPFSKQDIVDGVTKAYYAREIMVPYHEEHRTPGEPKYNIYEMEKELLNFQYKIQESKESKRKSIIYGVQPYHDDIFMTLAMLILGLKYASYGHFDQIGELGLRSTKRDSTSTGRQLSTVGRYVVHKKRGRDVI